MQSRANFHKRKNNQILAMFMVEQYLDHNIMISAH